MGFVLHRFPTANLLELEKCLGETFQVTSLSKKSGSDGGEGSLIYEVRRNGGRLRIFDFSETPRGKLGGEADAVLLLQRPSVNPLRLWADERLFKEFVAKMAPFGLSEILFEESENLEEWIDDVVE
jgi:hypothetical protein